jgi:hypothetical protein
MSRRFFRFLSLFFFLVISSLFPVCACVFRPCSSHAHANQTCIFFSPFSSYRNKNRSEEQLLQVAGRNTSTKAKYTVHEAQIDVDITKDRPDSTLSVHHSIILSICFNSSPSLPYPNQGHSGSLLAVRQRYRARQLGPGFHHHHSGSLWYVTTAASIKTRGEEIYGNKGRDNRCR